MSSANIEAKIRRLEDLLTNEAFKELQSFTQNIHDVMRLRLVNEVAATIPHLQGELRGIKLALEIPQTLLLNYRQELEYARADELKGDK